MQQYIYLNLAIKHQFSDISFYRKDDSVMTVVSNLGRNLCAPAHSQSASPPGTRHRSTNAGCGVNALSCLPIRYPL
ncbi:hypothetical protein D9M08_11510 [Escherichia albertii]|nr:hypothetical protein [Escherichia albertii]